MLDKLLDKLGLARKSEVTRLNSRVDSLVGTQYENGVLRRCIRELRKELRTALAPHIAPAVRAHTAKGEVGAYYTEAMRTVHHLHLPAVDLRCVEGHWLMRCTDSEELQRMVMEAWADEFQRALPDIMGNLK